MFLKFFDTCKNVLIKVNDFSILAYQKCIRLVHIVAHFFVQVGCAIRSVFLAFMCSAFISELKFGFCKFGQLLKRSFVGLTYKNMWAKCKRCVCDLFHGVCHCRVTARVFFTLLAPLLIIALILTSAYGMNDLTLANGVTYGGEFLGTVEDATVLQSAIDIFVDTVDAHNPGMYIEPAHLSTNLTNRTRVLDMDSLATAMLEHSELVRYGYGLYVNGILHAASETKVYFNRYLSKKLDIYRKTGENAILSFNDEIEIKENYFAVDIYRTEAQIESTIMDVLQLTVKKSVTEEYEVEVEYKTEEIESSSYSKGYRHVKRYGVNGKNLVTACVEYVNGEEISREVISTKVIEEPISKQIIVGTKVKQNSTKPKPIGGQLLWPVQDVDNVVITSYWGDGRNHKGLDIAAPKNTHIYAAMDGTVTFAGWSGGYGKLVKIRHSNSVETWYGHCNGYNVSVGDTVKMGEVIAFVGTTGDSTGNHVHFEVHIDGTRVNPAPYLGL